ncbi:hypothetical protein CHS0354_000460 [Potamilus streckersoni]|uniref:threonine--tRNA ligase n=1 Tax=Potamilus streckersoni TaxID=2493646 RepID=A0AAE0W8Z0_9BIVA|nr:hypothetical protein CHS0354_000460 [Potamilus streckersoni]
MVSDMENDLISVSLVGGPEMKFPVGVKALEVLSVMGKRSTEDALCLRFNGFLVDMSSSLNVSGVLELVDFFSEEGRAVYWHSTSHLMAQSMEDLFPGVRFGAGPAIENGFYYDVEYSRQFNEDDLIEIEKRMYENIKQDFKIIREEVSRDDAISYFTNERIDPFKVEILKETLKDEKTVSLYHQGGFTDLCYGPHVPSTGVIKVVKLTGMSTSYWRGDPSRQKMQRIYGVSFPSESLLKKHVESFEEAKKRDHRKIGQELGYFMFSHLVGSGLPIWLPKGAAFRHQLESFLMDIQLLRGYNQVYTPHVGSLKLYETSGHYPFYKESQFPPISFTDEDGTVESYMLKPMNCPHHHQVFSSKKRSYRELPFRLAEFGTVYRYEQSGELNGLLRARSFTQDDAHIYCMHDQLENEICGVIQLTHEVFNVLGFSEVRVRLSFRDKSNSEKYGGTDAIWEQAEKDIIRASERMKLSYFIGKGEASFYGPKIDFIVKDAIGRNWQLGTVQVDYVMSERFDLSFINHHGQKERPVIIHRAPFGSIERMTAILIENNLGDFPLWLAPVQISILTVADRHVQYGQNVLDTLLGNRFRANMDSRNEKIGKKIRESELSKIPYAFIIGDKELESSMVSVRKRFEGELGMKSLDHVVSHAMEFLIKRGRVRITIVFAGRQIIYKDQGYSLLKRVTERLEIVGKLEGEPKLEGKFLYAYYIPEKHKVELTEKKREKEEKMLKEMEQKDRDERVRKLKEAEAKRKSEQKI